MIEDKSSKSGFFSDKINWSPHFVPLGKVTLIDGSEKSGWVWRRIVAGSIEFKAMSDDEINDVICDRW